MHEVRGWGLIALDRAVGAVFQAAKVLRDQYRRFPTPELAKKLKYEADVHIVNALYFFQKTLEQFENDPGLMKELRNAVKGVIFGLIYQMSLKSLAASIKQELEFTKTLVKNFNKRFPRGMKWIESCKKFAREHLYFENPLGFRRHLWGYILPESAENAKRIHSEMDRMAVNSPIQGMCAGFMGIANRQLDKMLWEWRIYKKRVVELYVNNSVHDSLENEASYRDFLISLEFVERSMTQSVREVVQKRHGFDFVVDLEVDFEISASLSESQAWDFSILELERIVEESLIFQRDVLKHKLDVDATMELIFSQKADMAPWMKEQIRNLKYKFGYEGGTNLSNFRKEQEAKKAKKAAEEEAAEKAARDTIKKAKTKSKEKA